MDVSMPVQMRDALVQYLQTKPYGEVYAIIDALQRLASSPQLPLEPKIKDE